MMMDVEKFAKGHGHFFARVTLDLNQKPNQG